MFRRVCLPLTAFAFLTRFPVAADCAAETLARSLGWFPATGFVLGALAWLPGRLFAGLPLAQGLAYTAALIWMTRGLHWDGLADLCDAAGSGARGERFYEVLKDSRLGAFGAMGLVLGVLALSVLAGDCYTGENGLLALVLAPGAGRAMPIWLLAAGPVRPGSGLARALLPGASMPLAVFHAVLVCVALWWGLGLARALGAAMGFAALGVWLLRLARREAGLNGDFLGAGIVLGELIVLAAAVV